MIDDIIFFVGPGRFLDIRIKVVVPPLAALFTDATFQIPCDERPLFRTIPWYELYDLLIFLHIKYAKDKSKL